MGLEFLDIFSIEGFEEMRLFAKKAVARTSYSK